MNFYELWRIILFQGTLENLEYKYFFLQHLDKQHD